MENSNNEQKSADVLAAEKYPLIHPGIPVMDKRNAFITGYTTASSGMVKKEDVVKLIKSEIAKENKAIKQKHLHPAIWLQFKYGKSVLTELLTQINKL